MKEHITRLRVRYAETDQMAVVYYANYFVWFEVARVEFLRALNIDYKKLEAEGMYLVVTEATCQYLSPAYYDEVIFVKTKISGRKNISINFNYEVWNQKRRLLARGETAHAFVNRDKRPIKVPPEIRKLFDG